MVVWSATRRLPSTSPSGYDYPGASPKLLSNDLPIPSRRGAPPKNTSAEKQLRRQCGGCKLSTVLIGQRLRELRESKNLSQGDIEHRTGLIRCYTSRVENGHTVPSIETLEKYARALEVPLYRFFYDGEEPPRKPELPSAGKADRLWGASGKEWSELRRFAKALSRMDDRQRRILLAMAQRMAGRNRV
jgi:transcriptional regulator with XRE-family HTH domain